MLSMSGFCLPCLQRGRVHGRARNVEVGWEREGGGEREEKGRLNDVLHFL